MFVWKFEHIILDVIWHSIFHDHLVSLLVKFKSALAVIFFFIA